MLFLLLSLNLWAQNTVIQAESVSDMEYEQYLLENPQKKSYINNFKTGPNKTHMSKELLMMLKKAQYEFINGSLEQSKENFKSIFKLRHNANWDLNERKTIHYAIFRLAQLENNSKKREDYINKAITFDISLTPDTNLFPPPIIALFHKLKNQQRSKVWPLPKDADNFKTILINGVVTDAQQSFLQTTKGKKRFSFLSNKFEPIHIITDVKKLSLHKLPLKPLAQGNCENPQFSNFIQNEEHLGYFGKRCILPSTLQTPLTKMAQQPLNPPINTIEKKKISDNMWTWIGLTALTAVMTWKVLENQQKSPPSHPSSVQPTKTYISNSGASHQ